MSVNLQMRFSCQKFNLMDTELMTILDRNWDRTQHLAPLLRLASNVTTFYCQQLFTW
jgi:hypothetical protein